MRFLKGTAAERTGRLRATVTSFVVMAIAALSVGCASAEITASSPSATEVALALAASAAGETTTSSLSRSELLHERIQQEQAAGGASTTASAEATSAQSTIGTSTTATPTTATSTTEIPATPPEAILVLGDGRRLNSEQLDAVKAYVDAMKPLAAEQERIASSFMELVKYDLVDTDVGKRTLNELAVKQHTLSETFKSMSPPPILYEHHAAMITAGQYYETALKNTSYTAFQKGYERTQDAETLMEEFNYLLDSAHWE